MTNPMAWLQEERGIDGELLAHMGVRPVKHPQLGEAVAFPYRRDGKEYAGKFRKVSEKDWRSSQGVTRGLYNADALRSDDPAPAVITEGEMDCLSVIQAGFARAVSLPDGWTAQGNKTDALLDAEADLRRAPFVIVAGDNDEAGESLPRAVANILKGHDVRSVAWPDGCKDANDVLRALGEGALAECLNTARRIDPPGGFITGISDLPPLSRRRVLRVGQKEFDWRVALEVGAMSVVTGIPGHGKSTATTFLAHQIAMNERIRVGFMAFETHAHRIRDHLTRLATRHAWDSLSVEDKGRTAANLDRNFRIVHRTYDDVAHGLEWLESMVYALAVRDQCKLIIIDPWNELEHLPAPGESLTNYINWATQQLRQWAEKLDVHIQVVAHPRKFSPDQKPRPPTGYDIADSAAFFNKPSLGLTIHQGKTEDGLPVSQLITWKVRDVQLYGATKGTIDLHFDEQAMTYEYVEGLRE